MSDPLINTVQDTLEIEIRRATKQITDYVGDPTVEDIGEAVLGALDVVVNLVFCSVKDLVAEKIPDEGVRNQFNNLIALLWKDEPKNGDGDSGIINIP